MACRDGGTPLLPTTADSSPWGAPAAVAGGNDPEETLAEGSVEAALGFIHRGIEAAAKEQRQVGAVLVPSPTTVAASVAVIRGSAAFRLQGVTRPDRACSLYATNIAWGRIRPPSGTSDTRARKHTSFWEEGFKACFSM